MTQSLSVKMEVDDFLAHFGVMGMKWGQRKEEPAPQTQYNQGSVATNPYQQQYVQSQIDRRAQTTKTKKRSSIIGTTGKVLAVAGTLVAASYLLRNKTVVNAGKKFATSLFKKKNPIVKVVRTSPIPQNTKRVIKKVVQSPIVDKGRSAASDVAKNAAKTSLSSASKVSNNTKSVVQNVVKEKGKSKIFDLGPTPDMSPQEALDLTRAYNRWM